MGYAIMQVLDDSGDFVAWDGRLVPQADGTLGQVIVKDILEDHMVRVKGIDVAVGSGATVTVATLQVPVGAVYVVKGYGLSAQDSNIDTFTVKVDGVAESKVHLNTYQGGILRDYILIDNSEGLDPVDVVMEAHNGAGISSRVASGFLVAEDVTLEQAA